MISQRRWKTAVVTLSAVICFGFIANASNLFVRRAKTVHPVSGAAMTAPGAEKESTLLFNGWKISPVGHQLPTGDMLLGGQFSPDGKLYAVCNSGWGSHALHIFDVDKEAEVAKIALGRSWSGIAWSKDGKSIYISGGISNTINDVYHIQQNESGTWERVKGLKISGSDRQKTCIAGVALSADNSRLFVLNNSDNYMYVLNMVTGDTTVRLNVGDHPGAIQLSADGKTLYVANWGGSEVVALDVNNPDTPLYRTRFTTGEHPNALALAKDGRMFVSCGNSDSVSVLDTRTGRTIETIKTTLTPRSPGGTTPDSVAVSPDGMTLFVANADNNDVEQIDVSVPGSSRPLGFIPTGWYTTTVAVSADGKKLLIGSGKGIGSHPNPAATPINQNFVGGFPYIASQLNGSISFLPIPDSNQLAKFSKMVAANSPYRDSQMERTASKVKTVIPTTVGAPCPIKYVLYIIKENRTYDQVFGDISKGNGDPNLCLFGKDVSPNHHALAEQFVLLDDIYCNGEVSADGHPWSTSAYCTDFNERSWTLSYSGKGSTSGSDSVDVPTTGYIWDACKKKGLSYRSYGEYLSAAGPDAPPEKRVAGASGLIGHGSEKYVGVGRADRGENMRDTEEADIFISEFKEYERTKSIPQFMIMSLGEDHTHGTQPGQFAPKCCVASNDQAIGKIVETISHSSVWSQYAIFIIEDDAQNGPDHVDSHRTAAMVISPYIHRGMVDSTMYSTASLLHTMELILGLKPMTQYDAAATPLFASFGDKPDLTAYNLVGPRIALDIRNSAAAYGAAESKKMDFSDYDRVDEQALNRILWHSIKGRNVPMPAPVHRALSSSGSKIAAIQARDLDD